ncbi:Ulp1 family isopeptidase [Bradyrhizobium ottawaense]|uniref:Ulp1 family isopeptidase n=1 Tax=Bradyrhizobium ottawaense TaxID=931866 RepID=UPI001FE16D92|nr:Ulp1 family isopeptidase [Bradyrhizobium ottawaense]
MDPYNSDPSNPTAWSQVQHTVLEKDQGGHAGQEGFEQHLAEAHPPDPGPVSGGGRSGRNYHPHLSAEHRDIIDKAIAQYAAQKNPQLKTVKRYTQALRRLGNDLGAHRKTIDLRDHQSLVRHVKTYFPNDEDIKKGLGVLRAYHDPSYVASGGRPRTIPSAEDAPLSERLNASGMTSGSAARHDRSLRRFSNALNRAGYSISGLDDAARIEFAQKLFPNDELLLFALSKVRDAENVSGAGASQEPSGYAVPSPASHLYSDDARIIDGLEKAELSMLKPEETSRKKDVQNLARNQRRFAAWLQREGRGSLVSRLTGTSEQQKSFNDDYKDFKKSNRNADMGFDRLRNYLWLVEANAALGVCPEQAGGEPRRGESKSTWSPPEAVPDGSSAFYRGLDSFVDLPYTSQEVRDDAQSAPVGRAAARPPLFIGLSDAPAQSPDIFRGLQSFVDLPYTPQQMRDDAQSAPVSGAAAKPPLVTRPSDAPAQSSDIYRGLNSFVDLPYTPLQMRDDAQSAAVGGAAARPPVFTEPSEVPAQSSDIYRGLNSFVDLPYTPQQMRDDAQSAAVSGAAAKPPLVTRPSEEPAQAADSYRGLNSSVDLPYTPLQLRDDAQSAPVGRAAARPPLFTEPSDAPAQSSDIYRDLNSFVDLPYTPQQMRDDAQSAPVGGAAARPPLFTEPSDAPAQPSDIYGGLASLVHLDAPTPSELRDDAHFAPAPAARARSDAYRGFPLVDLTAPTPPESRDDANSVRPFPSTSANAQIGALDPTVSSHGHGLVLDDTEWLGDQHIDRDYGLQEQDLQRNDPDLAARTRFVNPLIALNYLRSNDDGVVLTEFQRIVYDDNGNDTADFLFLPVINGNPEDPNSRGNHWSLLFVDRSDRGRPVAYHYDSYGGLNNRDAEHLARRLNLPLELAVMAQQQNTYDCGVFVVDGTRELVRRLAQGREPDLRNLSDVGANRQALQIRLRG